MNKLQKQSEHELEDRSWKAISRAGRVLKIQGDITQVRFLLTPYRDNRDIS